nr:uncharacterized protein LOC105875868 isoform X1 [Microcebus murinus]XP_020142613.1 uncharacterized protein LOC105875868 isoform X1 [Microcebus murinus]XP_020142614.1 uncharacterized protein LOC105875868 isoform X1 [Microcebus murinus]
MWSRPSQRSKGLRGPKRGMLQEERGVSPVSAPVCEIPSVEDVCGEEEEEEEETGNETLLQVPRQESEWGLMAWPRYSREQAPWWEDIYFSLPPLPATCLCNCSLMTKVMLRRQRRPILPPRSTLQTLPSLSSKEELISLRDQPQMKPPSVSHVKTTKAEPKLPTKARPQVSLKRPSASQAPRQLAPVAVWPPVVIKPPVKTLPLKSQHAPSAKEASHSPGATPLPHLSPK